MIEIEIIKPNNSPINGLANKVVEVIKANAPIKPKKEPFLNSLKFLFILDLVKPFARLIIEKINKNGLPLITPTVAQRILFYLFYSIQKLFQIHLN